MLLPCSWRVAQAAWCPKGELFLTEVCLESGHLICSRNMLMLAIISADQQPRHINNHHKQCTPKQSPRTTIVTIYVSLHDSLINQYSPLISTVTKPRLCNTVGSIVYIHDCCDKTLYWMTHNELALLIVICESCMSEYQHSHICLSLKKLICPQIIIIIS